MEFWQSIVDLMPSFRIVVAAVVIVLLLNIKQFFGMYGEIKKGVEDSLEGKSVKRRWLPTFDDWKKDMWSSLPSTLGLGLLVFIVSYVSITNWPRQTKALLGISNDAQTQFVFISGELANQESLEKIAIENDYHIVSLEQFSTDEEEIKKYFNVLIIEFDRHSESHILSFESFMEGKISKPEFNREVVSDGCALLNFETNEEQPFHTMMVVPKMDQEEFVSCVRSFL